MIWLLSAIAIATIVIAGRAQSQRLDELDDQQCARLSVPRSRRIMQCWAGCGNAEAACAGSVAEIDCIAVSFR
jgi:hypothetical protein